MAIQPDTGQLNSATSGMDGQLQQAYANPPPFAQMPPDAPRPSNGVFSPGMESEEQEQNESPQEESTELRALIEQVNIAENLKKEQLTQIGTDAYRGYIQDKNTRQGWEKRLEEWTELAMQVTKEKTYPWPKSSNIKYPLLSTAAMQFAARAYPSLIPSNGQVVKSQVVGKDQTGEKQKKAERTSIYVSYQLMKEMGNWEEDMDRLLIMLPIVGTMFKKTYWDSVDQINRSELVLPKNLVVNYWAKCLDEAERVSEVLEMSQRIVKERQLAKIFRDVDLGRPPMPADSKNAPENDWTTPYTIIEQHTFLDLDDDGYVEPYIVTFHLESKEVLRITARFDDKSIQTDSEGNLVKIEPIQYYTKFGFIPNPDGSFYDIGFGLLLGPINDSVNTLINQLVDSGSLNNLQSGFIGKGLRIRMGEQRFAPGEWKAVNATGDDLRKQILPLPTKEPSKVLFELMGALISSGKELASVAEIFVGKMPGQNTPATTTMATIEQGMKVFTAVYKRIYRSLAEEYKKLYRLNEVYLNPQTYAEILDTTVNPDDFKATGYDICPGADPTAISQTERLLKAQGLVEMLPLGVLDPVKVATRVLEAQEQPNWQELLHPAVQQTGQPPQKPDPKTQELQMKAQAEEKKSALKQQEMAFKMQMEQRSQEFEQMMEKQRNDMQLQFEAMKLQLQTAAEQHKTRALMAQTQQKLQANEATHQQKMVHNDQAAKQKQEISKSQAQKTSGTGKTTR